MAKKDSLSLKTRVTLFLKNSPKHTSVWAKRIQLFFGRLDIKQRKGRHLSGEEKPDVRLPLVKDLSCRGPRRNTMCLMPPAQNGLLHYLFFPEAGFRPWFAFFDRQRSLLPRLPQPFRIFRSPPSWDYRLGNLFSILYHCSTRIQLTWSGLYLCTSVANNFMINPIHQGIANGNHQIHTNTGAAWNTPPVIVPFAHLQQFPNYR